jgi:hypothetical protein
VPGSPRYPPDNHCNKSTLFINPVITRALIFSLRKLHAELERQGVSKNTMIVFISDNGRPFPGDKTTLYDGGIPHSVDREVACQNQARTENDVPHVFGRYRSLFS